MMTRYLKFSIAIAIAGVFLAVAIVGLGWFVPTATAQDQRHSSVTGYFGIDEDGYPIPDRHGIMLVFDGPIAPETVSVSTFRVSLNDETFAEVIETRVDGPFVFLKLAHELTSDATPILGIAEGEEVEDLAGNSTNQRKFGFVQVKDGIAPLLAVTLSGGSGIGAGDEGPDRLTNDTIDIRITSDEPLQGAPRVVVVCESLGWTEREDSREVGRDTDDFVANRNGPFSRRPQEPPGTSYTCGYDADADGNDDVFELTEDVANSRPGEVWELTWRNPTGPTTSLRDGELVVVAYGRDRSRYERYGETVSNWATAKEGFGLDTQFGSENPVENVLVFPKDGSKVTESRPFILLEFPEATSIELKSVILDGVEIVGEFEEVGTNEFVFWPSSMKRGDHTVRVSASDSAANVTDFEFEFETVRRGDFVLELYPGWNAVSVPADPIDGSVSAVFSQTAVDAVVSYEPPDAEGPPWRMAVRRGGSLVANPNFGNLSEIRAGRGYWIKASSYVHQPIALKESVSMDDRLTIPPTLLDSKVNEWNFVGVVDVDGDQTESDFGKWLRDATQNEISARDYLGNFTWAYTWDAIRGRFERLLADDPMIIGYGVWVYYEDVAP